MDTKNIDAIDATSFVIAIIATASAPTLLAALPIFAGWWGFNAFRRSKIWEEWMVRGSNRMGKTPLLLLPPKSDSNDIVIPERRSTTISWADRITQPINYTQIAHAPDVVQKVTAEKAPLATILRNTPAYIRYDHPKIPDAPTPTSVLVGYDIVDKQWVWSDFGHNGDTIHAFIAGQTGSGKDSQIRLWYTQLTSNNSPQDIKFIVLDGKGEWLTPALVQSQHMLIKPVGGFDPFIDDNGKLRDRTNEQLEQAVITTFQELKRRNDEFQKVGATNILSYQQKTGIKLPLLFIIATDMGTNLEGNLEMLVKMLTYKGRSLGVRLIISMQSASGEATGWRGQLALAMSGFQQLASADAPNLGINARALLYRPSQLPSPDEPKNRGLFVVRKGNKQTVVKAVHLPDDVFETYCEAQTPQIEADTLLSSLLNEPMEILKPKPVKPVLTKEQAKHIAQLARLGKNKSDIMYEMGWTNGNRYKEVSPAVDMIITAARRGVRT